MGAYQSAFREWHDSAKATIAALDNDAERGGKLEKSFQSCLDDVTLEQLGYKLIGPSSTGLMTQEVKQLNAVRAERERDLRTALSDPCSSHKDRADAVRSYRRAKADAMTAVETRKQELELQIFKKIESTQSDSKLFWSNVAKISDGLLGSVSPPPMAMNDKGKVETDPLKVLRVWKEFSEKLPTRVLRRSVSTTKSTRMQWSLACVISAPSCVASRSWTGPSPGKMCSTLSGD